MLFVREHTDKGGGIMLFVREHTDKGGGCCLCANIQTREVV